MELLLNLAWLLLILPAYHLWRGSRTAVSGQKLGSLQTLLALACVLVILFPVVSATDDLHAMRAEIEESPSSKRSVLHASSDKASGWNLRLQSPPAIVENPRVFAPIFERSNITPTQNFLLPTGLVIHHVGRSPPHVRFL
jgi:hypothetical protein